jgi:hypothetical protein
MMVEHEFFVDFIKSLRPNFSFKSRITTRKEILDIPLAEKKKLFDQLKIVSCWFSATMDMWTSNQNKAICASQFIGLMTTGKCKNG